MTTQTNDAVAEAVKREREECVKIAETLAAAADEYNGRDPDVLIQELAARDTAYGIATAIRARGEESKNGPV